MSESPLFTYLLRLADNALVLGHRLSEWSGHGPTLEEDIALSNLALDLIGQARLLYTYAGKIEGAGRDEDALAYLRDDRAYTNVLLVEQPNGDFANTMVRQLIFSAFILPFLTALSRSKDETLSGFALKAEKEMAYHLRHAGEWVIRLGDGTDESHRRAQSAVDGLMVYCDELFETDAVEHGLIAAGIAADPALFRADFDATIDHILDQARLTRTPVNNGLRGGRVGMHSEYLSHLLAEMQLLHRAHPGVNW